MSFYSSIDRRINADRWFRSLSHMAQLVWFRLLTGSHVTPVAGLWPATEDQLAKAFTMSRATFRKYYEEIAGMEEKPTGKVYADWDAGVIWFPRAIHVPANQPRNENSLRGWAKHIELVPECDLRDVALSEIIGWVNSQSGENKRFPRGLPNGFPTPNRLFPQLSLEQLTKQFQEQLGKHVPRAQQEQDHEQEQEQEHVQPPPQPVDEFPDSDQSKPLGLNFKLHPLSVAELASWSGFPEPVILAAVNEFVGYWTIGGGKNQPRSHWQSKCRDDIRRKHDSGMLEAIARKHEIETGNIEPKTMTLPAGVKFGAGGL